MFDYFKGFITDKRKNAKGNFISLEVLDSAYLLEVTERDFSVIKVDEESKRKLYVLLSHREDAMSLYAFLNKETRDIFQILISVSGVGAKMAIALLNEFDVCDLISFVIDGDYKELTKAKGVGPKLAQKIILELKDKLIKVDYPRCSIKKIQSPAIEDAQTVLISLGYEEQEINEAIAKISLQIDDKTTSEEVLRKVLTLLSM